MTKNKTKIRKWVSKFCLVALASTSLGLAACSHSGANVSEYEVYDPLEEINRSSFKMNDALDQAIARPLAKGYSYVTPEPVRDGVSNFLRNLRSPINFGNQVLQGDAEGALTDLMRAMINTTLGMGGFVDLAEHAGLEYEQEDFGQTLAVWGVDHGAYLVLPLWGPSSVRDLSGRVVDSVADPLNMYLHNTDQEEWIYARIGTTAISKREELLDVLDDLRENSFDYYAALRSSYMQRRDALVHDESPENADSPAIPDYEDF
jgi:phospholipid-binding lipoprotein MlaA